jgi:hypothetical protein
MIVTLELTLDVIVTSMSSTVVLVLGASVGNSTSGVAT